MGEGQRGLRDDKQNQSSQSETPEHDRDTKLEREVATERYPERDRLGERGREVWGWGWWGSHTHLWVSGIIDRHGLSMWAQT